MIGVEECRVALLIGDIYREGLPEPFGGMADIFQYRDSGDVEHEVLIDPAGGLLLKIKAFSTSKAGEMVSELMSENTDSFVLANSASGYALAVRRFVRQNSDLLLRPILSFNPTILVAGQTVLFEELVLAVVNGSSVNFPHVIRFSSLFYGEPKGHTSRTAANAGYQFDMKKSLDLLGEVLMDTDVLRSALEGHEAFAQALERHNGKSHVAGYQPIVPIIP